MLLFSYIINVSVTDGHFVDCMCIRECTYCLKMYPKSG